MPHLIWQTSILLQKRLNSFRAPLPRRDHSVTEFNERVCRHANDQREISAGCACPGATTQFMIFTKEFVGTRTTNTDKKFCQASNKPLPQGTKYRRLLSFVLPRPHTACGRFPTEKTAEQVFHSAARRDHSVTEFNERVRRHANDQRGQKILPS